MAMTFSTNGHDSDSGEQESMAATGSPVGGPAGTGPIGSELGDLVRGEIGDLTSEFRRTVDRVGERINTLVQSEVQRALAEVLLGGAPMPRGRHAVPADGPLAAATMPQELSPNGYSDGGAGVPKLTVVGSVPATLPEQAVSPEPGVSLSPVELEDPSDAPNGTLGEVNAQGVDIDSTMYADSPMYEGVVRLQVRSSGCTCQSTQFVRAVSRMPELRVMRLVGTAGTGLELLVGLRQPLQLERVLMEMDRVASVRRTRASNGAPNGDGGGGGAGEQELAVWLVDSPSSHGPE